MTEKQKLHCKKFKDLHHQGSMFILANAWDVGSAYIFEKEGFPALGTSSQGMALALGYPDGQKVNLDDMLFIVKRMVERVDIPVSVDIERGFSDTIPEMKAHCAKFLDIGVVGFNIEDGRADKSLDDLPDFLAKIKALKELKEEYQLDFVINARTCTYWLAIGEEKDRLNLALERAKAFVEAGADCVFFPGLVPMEDIEVLTKEIDAPVNILLTPATSDIEALRQKGVTRLSIGSGPARSTMNHIIEMAQGLQQEKSDKILKHPFVYAPANAYFTKESS